MVKRLTISVVDRIPEEHFFDFDIKQYADVSNNNPVNKKNAGKKEGAAENDDKYKELMKKISDFEKENRELRKILSIKEKLIEKKDKYYPVLVNISRLEREEEINKIIEEHVEKEITLNTEIMRLRRTGKN